MISVWGVLILLALGVVFVLVIILAFCGVYWGVVKSVDTASEVWKQRAEARQDEKWQVWQDAQNPMTSLLRASDATINTPDVLVRPTMTDSEAKPEELLRPVDEDGYHLSN